DRAVRPGVRVVRVRELARRRPGDARAAVAPDNPVGADVDLRDAVVELLVRDHAVEAGGEEGVVGIEEGLAGPQVARARELPDDPLRGRDDQQLVRVAVGDQHIARDRAGRHGRQAEGTGGRALDDVPPLDGDRAAYR